MSNIQHSSRSDIWYTPKWLVDLVRKVLPVIDLDPASDDQANKTIKARRIITSDSLQVNWCDKPSTIYLNPPGGKIGNKSQTGLFWDKLISVKNQGLLSEAVFMGFSLEHLAVTQASQDPMCNYTVCIPSKRIHFVNPEGLFSNPTHSNVIVYIPGQDNNMSVFKDVFRPIGALMQAAD